MKKLGILLIVVLMAVAFSACEKDEESSNNNNDNNGNNDDPTNTTEGYIELDNQDLMAAGGVPVVDENDNVYLTLVDVSSLEENTTIICLDADNSIKWQSSIGESTNKMLMSGDKLFLGCKNNLYAINISDGSQAWQFEITDANASASSKWTYKPILDPNGNIIVAMDAYKSSDNSEDFPARIVSVSPSGAENWEYMVYGTGSFEIEYTKLSEPVGTGNYFYIGAFLMDEYMIADVQAYAFDYDGKLQYETSLGEYGDASFICANKDENVYLSIKDSWDNTNKLMCLDNELNQNWEAVLPDYLANNGVIDATGNLYVGCEDGFLYKLDNSGSEVWKAEYGSIYIRGEMIIGKDGNIYHTCQSPDYVSAETGEITEMDFDGLSLSDLGMRSDGSIVFGGSGKIYMMETNAGSMDDNAQWAKYGCDRKNTSLVN